MNMVNVISKGNKVRVFIDGIEIKGLQSVKSQRDVSNTKTIIELKFKCDLYTKEQPIEEVVPSVEK